MQQDDRIRIQHMLDAAQEAAEFIRGKPRRSLTRDRQLVLALLKSVEIIGEAATRVSEEVQESHPNIPWKEIIAMRNRLIHVYFDINLEILWKTVKEDIPL
ncbi:MAG: DUF86 domain-containing protein [bacterium]|nr:DUF86 domain-containing protein [bacterium]